MDKIVRFPRLYSSADSVNEKVINKVLAGMNAYFKKKKQEASVVTLNNSIFAKPKIYISTGIVALDCIVGYGLGFPPGIIEVYGPEHSGKTAILEETLAAAQKKQFYTALFPMEFSPDYRRMKSVGINKKLLVVFEDAETIEDVYELTRDFVIRLRKIDKTTPIVIGWDSLASTPTRSELEHKEGLKASDMGKFALQMSKFFRRLVKFLFTNNVCLVCTNQTRSTIGGYGNPETTYGGKAIKYYAWVRCRIGAGKPIKDSDGKEIGMLCTIKTKKNKFAPPMQTTEIPIYWKSGIDSAEAAWYYCINQEIVVRTGSVYKLNGNPISRRKFAEKYREYPDKTDKLMIKSAQRNGD